MKNGDKVILRWDNNTYSLGMLVNYGDEKSKVIKATLKGTFDKIVDLKFESVATERLININRLEDILGTLEAEFDKEINDLESQFKSTARSDYNEEINKEYNRLKELIINTSRNMMDDYFEYPNGEDEKFEDRLKQLCQLKKKMFSIPCDEAREARKHNGSVKFNIKRTRRLFEEQLLILIVELFDEAMNK